MIGRRITTRTTGDCLAKNHHPKINDLLHRALQLPAKCSVEHGGKQGVEFGGGFTHWRKEKTGMSLLPAAMLGARNAKPAIGGPCLTGTGFPISADFSSDNLPCASKRRNR